jgi:hypothetical protein
MPRRAQLSIILAILAVALVFALREGLRERVVVIAQDGTPVVIELDPDNIREWSGTRAMPLAPEEPLGNPKSANLEGTKAR